MVQRVAVAAMLAAAGCAADSDHEPGDRKPDAPATRAAASTAAPAADPNAGMVAHAPHFEPASRHLPPLAPLPARLPASGDGRHDRRVDDAEPPDATDAQAGVDDGVVVAVATHAAGADGVEDRRADIAGVDELVVTSAAR